MLEAYTIALSDRSDWQVQRAVTSELPRLSDWPIDATALNTAAAKFKRSEAEEIAAVQAERDRLALPRPYANQAERFTANRKAMRDECKALIASGKFGQDEPGSFCREMLAVLDACAGDPTQDVRKVLFGIRARGTKRGKEKTAAAIKAGISRGDAWETP